MDARLNYYGSPIGSKVAKHYDDGQLAALVCQIGLINTWNRLNVITQQSGPGRGTGLDARTTSR
jgi:hypothetical protein